jgi:type IV secretory pathway protease TraF
LSASDGGTELEQTDRGKRRSVKRTLIALSAAALCGVCVLALASIAKWQGYFIAINDSYSFPNRLYLAREGSPATIKRGSIVIFQIDHLSDTPYAEKLKDRVLFKKVACIEGDYMQRIDNRFICYLNGKGEQESEEETGEANGSSETIAIVRSTDSEGNPYAISFDYNGTVPIGKLFVTAPHYMSFDSRYFGFIDAKAVKGEILWAIY